MIKALQYFEASVFYRSTRPHVSKRLELWLLLCDLEVSLFRLDLFRAQICSSGLLCWLIVRPQYVLHMECVI